VETVAADAGAPELFGQGKARGGFGQGAVKNGVEAGELRDVGEEMLRLADQSQGRRNVERSEVGGGLQLFEDSRGNFLVFAKGGAAVDDAVAECARLESLGVRLHCPVIKSALPVAGTYGRDPDGNVFEILEVRDPSHPLTFANRRLAGLKEIPA